MSVWWASVIPNFKPSLHQKYFNLQQLSHVTEKSKCSSVGGSMKKSENRSVLHSNPNKIDTCKFQIYVFYLLGSQVKLQLNPTGTKSPRLWVAKALQESLELSILYQDRKYLLGSFQHNICYDIGRQVSMYVHIYMSFVNFKL